MSKRPKKGHDREVREIRERAKKERKRKRKAEERFASVAFGQGHGSRDFFFMCDKKRAYGSETEAMMAAAHSRSGDPLRWYKCPYSTPQNPHWHLTKTPKEKFEGHPDGTGGNSPELPEYPGIGEPCFVVRSSETPFPVLVFASKLDALRWAAKNKSFEPFTPGECEQWHDQMRVENYDVGKSGVLCLDASDAMRLLGNATRAIWEDMGRAEMTRDECLTTLRFVRKSYRRLGRESDMDEGCRRFLDSGRG